MNKWTAGQSCHRSLCVTVKLHIFSVHVHGFPPQPVTSQQHVVGGLDTLNCALNAVQGGQGVFQFDAQCPPNRLWIHHHHPDQNKVLTEDD